MGDKEELGHFVDAVFGTAIAIDQDGNILAWNEAASILFGWARTQMLGRSIAEALLDHQDRSRWMGWISEAQNHRAPRTRGAFKAGALKSDGSKVEVELSLGRLPDGTEIVFARRPNEAREPSNELTASQVRFRAAIEAVRGVLWTNNGAGEMAGEQPAWGAFTGQPYDEYQGYGWTKAVHPDDVEATVEAWRLAVKEKRPFSHEHRVRRHDGVWRTFAISAAPSIARDGAVIEWVGVHTDITERTQAEVRLKESEVRFKAIADSAPAPVWITTAGGEIAFANQAFATFAGVPRDLVSASTWTDRIHPEDRASVGHARATARAVPEDYDFEARFLRHDGAYRWIYATANPRFGRDGVFEGYVGMAVDITDAKQATLRQQLLINELNHRVKNTLTTIQSIARQTLAAEISSKEARDRFLNRLFALSRAHDLLTRHSWESAEIRDVVDQALGPFIDESSNDRFHISGGVALLSPITALALSLALHELATNAVKYGALSVNTGLVEIAWSTPVDDSLNLRWKERGGPAVQAPQHRGFGTRLLAGGLTSDLGGRPQLDFATDGVEARLQIRTLVGSTEHTV